MYFLIPKKDSGLRPILDLRQLNAYIKSLPFKMLHTKHILESVEQGEWFTTIDLKDAYFHVPICWHHWKFLRFAFRGQAYESESSRFVSPCPQESLPGLWRPIWHHSKKEA